VQFHATLDDLIGGKTSVRVLRILSLFPEKEFTGRQLASASGGAPSKVIQELERFRRLGIVRRKSHGRTHAWRANPDHALLRLVAPMFEGERKLPETFLSELDRGVDDTRISRAILFGSFARGDEKNESDVDLLVIAERAEDIDGVRIHLDDLSSRLGTRFGLRLSAIVHSESDVPRFRKTALASNIRAEGRTLRGEPL
jgi:predicted nucleotidyltransferase